MFSATVITGISMKCWCTIPIPLSIASLAERERDLLALQVDLARVRVVEPVEDVHQRRLAGAVLTEQRVHLALEQIEADVVVGEHARELLGDPDEREDGSVGHASGDSFTQKGGPCGPPFTVRFAPAPRRRTEA